MVIQSSIFLMNTCINAMLCENVKLPGFFGVYNSGNLVCVYVGDLGSQELSGIYSL